MRPSNSGEGARAKRNVPESGEQPPRGVPSDSKWLKPTAPDDPRRLGPDQSVLVFVAGCPATPNRGGLPRGLPGWTIFAPLDSCLNDETPALAGAFTECRRRDSNPRHADYDRPEPVVGGC